MVSPRNKIDSNETSANYAEEQTLGVLSGSPTWFPLEPNSYSDFGGALKLLARNPINASRQRKKGAITDLDAKAGFNQDFTQANMQNLLKGVMFANYREKPNGSPATVSGTAYVFADASAFLANMILLASGFANAANNGIKIVTGVTGTDVQCAGLVVDGAPAAGAKIVCVGFTTAAGVLDVPAPSGLPTITGVPAAFAAMLIPGEWIFVGGDGGTDAFTNDANNGFKRVFSAVDTTVTFDLSQTTMVTEANTTKTVKVYFGRVLKNELGALIKRRSYQLERLAGAPDADAPSVLQSEYVAGSMINEFIVNIKQADKITADINWISIDNQQRTAADGPKAGTRVALVEADCFNTSSDFAMMRMNIIDPANANPDPLFAFLSDLKFTLKNNIKPNKAIAILGAFDLTAGTFEVSADATAYFATIEAVQAVRQNANVEINCALVKENAGFVFDLPLIALGNGQLDVKQDEPIMIPLTIDAATAAKINPNTDYTAMWVFFDYLPNLASPE